MPPLPSLRRIREAKPWTQQELANASGVHRVTIASIEAGDSARPSTVRKLAAALAVEAGELMAPPAA